MVEHKYDVVIVGARVAGASLAILLGKQGKKVLLIDKATFPSDTLSTHHLSHTQYLKALGVLERVESKGLRRLERMRTYIGNSFIEGPKSEYSLAPRRNHLDSILVEKACEYKSVTLYENTKLKRVIVEEGKVKGVQIQRGQEDSQNVLADLVVGADGVHSRVAKLVEAEAYKEQDPIRPVFYGYYEGIEPLPEPATEIFLNEGRIGFLFPMESNVDWNIGEGEDWEQEMEGFHTKRDEKMLPAYRLTLEYIQRLQPYSREHLALFNALCANPIALSKLTPHLPNMLKDVSHNIPELYGSIEMEAEALHKK